MYHKMALNTRFIVNHNLKRCLCSSATNCGKYAPREARFMRKIMSSDVGKRVWHQNKPRLVSDPIGAEKLTSNHVTRRMAVLNKLFMQHVTDLLATGDAYTQLVGRRIEITRVKVTPDFQRVNVYWGSKLAGKEAETAKLLNDCAFGLRHELTQLRVIGQVPMIQFVRDRQLAGLAELEKRFAIADYGEDFEPTVAQVIPRHELTLATKLTPEIREKVLELEGSLDEEEEDDDSKYDVALPPMRNDVLGLNHDAIMNRVQSSLRKMREGAQNRFLNMKTIYPSQSPFDPKDLVSSERSEAFTDFLAKRQLEEKRKLRRERNESVMEYHLRTNYPAADEDDVLLDDEKDVDPFEDVDLATVK